MKRGVLPALAWLALVCASWGMMGCSDGGDDDDAAVDDDLAATDDDAGADDDVSDDDLAADDDAADDDDDNDADLQLLIIGRRDDQTMSSWRYRDGAWEEQPMPLPLGANQYYLGPSAVIDGAAGHAVWNIYRDGVWLSREHTQTTSVRWLTYESKKGWQRNLTMAQPGSATNLSILTGAETGALWAGAFYQFEESLTHPPYTHRYAYASGIARYDRLVPTMEWMLWYAPLRALSLAGPDAGLASYTLVTTHALIRYDGAEWQDEPMPYDHTDGYFLSLAMSDSNHAYGIWQDAAGSGRELLELTEGTWSKVAAPAGCGDVWPTRVWMVGDRIIAATIGDFWEVRFWEHRDGDWTCRRLAEGTRHAAQQDFVIRTDGRVFATGTWSDTDGPFLLEVTATDVVDIPLPANLSTAERVHVLGAAAPAQSNFAISNQIPGS